MQSFEKCKLILVLALWIGAKVALVSKRSAAYIRQVKMLRCLVLFLLVSAAATCFAQQAETEDAFRKARVFFEQRKADPNVKNIYFNSDSCILYIEYKGSTAFRIPLKRIELQYQFERQSHFVAFKCNGRESCIVYRQPGKTGYPFSYSSPFKNKLDCYRFIKLMKDVQERCK
jgi:hypothetical protein